VHELQEVSLSPASFPLTYPSTAAGRIRFVIDRRGLRSSLDPLSAYGAFVESEPDGLGSSVSAATILLTNRECPWKCVFCDLWKNTLDETVPAGEIPAQIQAALAKLPAAPWIKLYNAGSFFDPRAIPPADYAAIAEHLAPFERIIIESHPALIDSGVGSRVDAFRELLSAQPIHSARSIMASQLIDAARPAAGESATGASLAEESDRAQGSAPRDVPLSKPTSSRQAAPNSLNPEPRRRLEVAMGLETVHPLALERLNKGMTLDDFARAADVLRRSDVDLRAFVLVQPPFTPPEEAVHWALRSLDFARDQGARLVAFIPTRGGNGAMEALAATGDFVPPRLSTLEEVLDRALENTASRRGPLVVADLWDLERFSHCPTCFPARKARLHRMNLSQRIEPRISCDCGS